MIYGVRLDESHTTLDLQHKRLTLGGLVYFVAKYPEGDAAVHSWNPSGHDQQGYGASLVSFLMEDGSVETVRGPFNCGDLFDHGTLSMLKHVFGIQSLSPAFRLVIGKNLEYAPSGPRYVHWEEPAMACGDLAPRLRAALDRQLPCEDFSVAVVLRNSVRHLSMGEIAETLRKGVKEC